MTSTRVHPSLKYARDENPNWFQKSVHPETEADYLVVYHYPAVPIPEFHVNPKEIFDRLAGTNAWTIWEEEGTIILPNIFSYLNLTDIVTSFNTEFDMYLHHYRPVLDCPQMGFLRNMFYSLTQQLIRQDPVWYALMVAA